MKEIAALQRVRSVIPWLPAYFWQRCRSMPKPTRPLNLIIGIANHFEPMNRATASEGTRSQCEQEQRLRTWCKQYPETVNAWRDNDGYPLRHTYFYPAEHYDEFLVDCLAEHCHSGWGEVEIHLHHGVNSPDTKENTFRTLVDFRDALAARDCLCRENGTGGPRYGFVHGNWALANSDHGRFCGVDEEMQILADTGCYADFTLPAPSSAQIGKINSMYECTLPLNARAPHRRGSDLRRGYTPVTFPLIIQGPLMIDFGRRRLGFPAIEYGELSGINPPTLKRLRLWKNAAISVLGRPDWVFIKLHCHGLEDRSSPALLGAAMRDFLQKLIDGPGNKAEYSIYFVTMREMVNIALAACDGRTGSPGEYRDYRFQPIAVPCRN